MLVPRLMVLTLAVALGGMVTLSPVATGTATAASGRETGLASHRDPAGPSTQRWTAPRRWATADDWEPNVAASQTSAWVYQLTTRYSHPSQCARAKGHCIVFRASANHGRTWKATRAVPSRYCPPARHRCVLARNQNDPVLAVSTAGVIYAAWMDDWDVVFMRSADHGRTWHDQADFRRAAGLSFTDKPWIAISRSGRDVYVAFNASNSYIAASHDYGRTWSRPVRTNSDHRYWFAEGGAVARSGSVYFAESAEHQSAKGNIELTVITSADGGRRWGTKVIATSQQQPRCRVADCPNDFFGSQISLAVDRSGTVLAAYCANKKAGTPLSLFIRSAAGGRRWSQSRLVSSLGTAVGVGFPKVVAGLRPGVFEVGWEDDRNGPAAWNVWASRTVDGGAVWSSTHQVSRSGAGFVFPYGDYFGMTIDGSGTFYLTWSAGHSYDGPGSTWWSKVRSDRPYGS
ncbi:MAG TPA: sialidase family protein [Streptosporangiaceae bacterium]